MVVLGYSGLNDSILYRKKFFDNLTDEENKMYQGADAAAVIVKDGYIIAAVEEERFNLEKHTSCFPVGAINFCLRAAGIDINQVDFICHGFNFSTWKPVYEINDFSRINYAKTLSPESQMSLFEKYYNINNIKEKFVPVNHHMAHAASAFYPSFFEKALIIVADGMGEVESISVFLAQNNTITKLKSYDILSSLGIFYSLITNHLGFEVNSDEYKTMGLAPYGNPSRYISFFEKCIELKENGEVFISAFLKNRTMLDKYTYRPLKTWISESTFPSRKKGEEIIQMHKDLAAGLQAMLNNAMLHIASYWNKKTGLQKLCLAGGVALNCVANSVLLNSKLFTEIYVPPAASDAGTALGAALYKCSTVTSTVFSINNNPLPLLGPSFDRQEILNELSKYSQNINFIELDNGTLVATAASMIAQGMVVAWFQGAMEFGPRALGNRSIIADARCPNMQDRINQIVKKRESFRPFAPSVKLEKAHIYFDIALDLELPHMLFTVPVREKYRKLLPAVTHIDHSARVQTVNKKDHPLYWSLLDEFEKISGIPIILNTSFNVKGQPIVCTPGDAVNTLLSTNIDVLFINNFRIRRNLI